MRDIAEATGHTEGAIYWHLKQIYQKQSISRQVGPGAVGALARRVRVRGSAAGGGLLWPPYQRASRSDAFTRDSSADRDRGFRAVRPHGGAAARPTEVAVAEGRGFCLLSLESDRLHILLRDDPARLDRALARWPGRSAELARVVGLQRPEADARDQQGQPHVLRVESSRSYRASGAVTCSTPTARAVAGQRAATAPRTHPRRTA